jgi:hypothetical protein
MGESRCMGRHRTMLSAGPGERSSGGENAVEECRLEKERRAGRGYSSQLESWVGCCCVVVAAAAAAVVAAAGHVSAAVEYTSSADMPIEQAEHLPEGQNKDLKGLTGKGAEVVVGAGADFADSMKGKRVEQQDWVSKRRGPAVQGMDKAGWVN